MVTFHRKIANLRVILVHQPCAVYYAYARTIVHRFVQQPFCVLRSYFLAFVLEILRFYANEVLYLIVL